MALVRLLLSYVPSFEMLFTVLSVMLNPLFPKKINSPTLGFARRIERKEISLTPRV